MTITGSAASGFVNGPCKLARFNGARSICFDPLHPTHFFIGDQTSVRYCDGVSVRLVAGSAKEGFANGKSDRALFCEVTGLVCSGDAKQLFVSDARNYRIRSIDLATREVSTLAGTGHQREQYGIFAKASFLYIRTLKADRSKSNSLLVVDGKLIRRVLLDRRIVQPITPVSPELDFSVLDPSALESFASGHLLVTCLSTHSLYLINPTNQKRERIAGTGTALPVPVTPGFMDGAGVSAQFNSPRDLVVSEAERCAFIADVENNRIRRIELPPHLFVAARPSTASAATKRTPIKTASPAGAKQ